MRNGLSEAEQVHHYRDVRKRLGFPTVSIVPAPRAPYEFTETPRTSAWVCLLRDNSEEAGLYKNIKRWRMIDCINTVCRYYKIPQRDLISQRRNREIVRKRQVSMYLSRHLTTNSFPEIGKRHGDRDHTTAIHAVRTIERLIGVDGEITHDVAALLRRLGYHGPIPRLTPGGTGA